MARPPASLNDFIGQRRVIGHVRKLVAGARVRGEAVGSLLLLGPPGMGKTALAEAIAREYGGMRAGAPLKNFVRILGGPRITLTLVEKLAALEYGDFLFIDEVHALDREAQELLHLALDERRTLGSRDGGRLDRGTTRTVAEFSLIGASTEPGKVTQALRSRLHQIMLDSYEPLELKVIAEKGAQALGIQLTPHAAGHLAKRSQQTPRSVEKLLKELCVTHASVKKLDTEHVNSFLNESGIDDRGLNRFQQQFIEILRKAGRPVSLNVARSRLGIDKAYIQSDLEPYLLHLGLVDVGPTGRTLTERGRVVANRMARLRPPVADDGFAGQEDDAVAGDTAVGS